MCLSILSHAWLWKQLEWFVQSWVPSQRILPIPNIAQYNSQEKSQIVGGLPGNICVMDLSSFNMLVFGRGKTDRVCTIIVLNHKCIS